MYTCVWWPPEGKDHHTNVELGTKPLFSNEGMKSRNLNPIPRTITATQCSTIVLAAKKASLLNLARSLRIIKTKLSIEITL